jgi:preprotein translocase subunit SecD
MLIQEIQVTLDSHYPDSLENLQAYNKSEPELVGDVDEAEVLIDQASDAYYIAIQFKPGGTEGLSRTTRENVGRRLAIMLDEKIHSAPVIMAPITGGRVSISGKFTFKEARELAIVLKSGAIPVPISVLAAHFL